MLLRFSHEYDTSSDYILNTITAVRMLEMEKESRAAFIYALQVLRNFFNTRNARFNWSLFCQLQAALSFLTIIVNLYCLVMLLVKLDLRKLEFILVGVACLVDLVFTGGFNLFISAQYASIYVEDLCYRHRQGYLLQIHYYGLGQAEYNANGEWVTY